MVTIFMKHKCYYDHNKGKFSNYLATMVRNACRSLKRKERWFVDYEEADMVRICEENGAVANFKKHELDEIREMIEEGIISLRKKKRSTLMLDAFTMMFIEDERPKYIAEKLNVRADYVSLAKNHCLPALRAILREIMNRDN